MKARAYVRRHEAYWRARAKSEAAFDQDAVDHQGIPILQRIRGFTDGWLAAVRWMQRNPPKR